jgi:glycosyltransferase involved in cell wall biosynthesis
MKLLFVTQYYPPETGAASNRVSDLAERLASFGHEVTVVAPMPSYPEGTIFDGYRGRFLMEERRQNVRVVRTWNYATKSERIVQRLLSYFSFVFTSVLGARLKIDRQDVVFVASPPLFLGIAGMVLKRFWRTKMVFNVSDLWPKSAIELGVVKNSRLLRIASTLESMIYKHSDLITGQTQGIVADIHHRTRTPVLLWTNGIDPSAMLPLGNREKTRQQFGLDTSHFVVGYAGLHGLAQGLVSVLAAAEDLRGERGIKFVLFGDGPKKKQLMKIAARRHLDNVKFFPNQPKARMPEIMSVIDVSLVPLRRLELFKGALPSKMFEAMGAGVPVIVSVEGEAKDLVERARGGISVAPEDPRALADAILLLRDSPDLCQRMGTSGKQFISTHYDRRLIAQSMELALSALTSSDSRNAAVALSGGM